MWYNPHNELLIKSSIFEIGRQRSQNAELSITPQEFIFADQKPKEGLLYGNTDMVVDYLLYKKNTNINRNF